MRESRILIIYDRDGDLRRSTTATVERFDKGSRASVTRQADEQTDGTITGIGTANGK